MNNWAEIRTKPAPGGFRWYLINFSGKSVYTHVQVFKTERAARRHAIKLQELLASAVLESK